MLKRRFIFLTVLFFFFGSSLLAVSARDFLSFDNQRENRLVLAVGEVTVFEVTDLERVSVRNPEIADISRVDGDEVVVVARRRGNTVLTVWSKGMKEEFYILVHSKELDRAKKELKDIIYGNLGIKNINFRKNEAAGKIMIIGEVPPYQKIQIDQVLEEFEQGLHGILVDNFVIIAEETKMVEIEAQVLELTKGMAESLGFDWPGTAGTDPTPMATLTAPATTGTWSDAFRVVEWTRAAFDIQIRAALSEGRGRILARPKLLCLSGEEASFLVGGEIPVVTASSTAAGDTVAEDVEYKEYGVKLNISPVVLRDGSIRLALNTEVSDLSSEGQYVRSDGTVIRAFTTRNISSVLRLNEGQAVIMSGLLKDRISKDDISQVPGLGNVPILGALFRSKDYQQDQTELVISLVPRIIDSQKRDFKGIVTPRKERMVSKERVPFADESYLREKLSRETYALEVKRKLTDFLVYPRLARDTGWRGRLKLKLHLSRRGDLLDVDISEPSGYLSFDRDVLTTAKSLSPYPPFPSDIEAENLWIEIPIFFGND